MKIIITTDTDDRDSIAVISDYLSMIKESGIKAPHFKLKGRDTWVHDYDLIEGQVSRSISVLVRRIKDGISICTYRSERQNA